MKLSRRDILALLRCIDIYACDYHHDREAVAHINKTKLKLLKGLAALNEKRGKI